MNPGEPLSNTKTSEKWHTKSGREGRNACSRKRIVSCGFGKEYYCKAGQIQLQNESDITEGRTSGDADEGRWKRREEERKEGTWYGRLLGKQGGNQVRTPLSWLHNVQVRNNPTRRRFTTHPHPFTHPSIPHPSSFTVLLLLFEIINGVKVRFTLKWSTLNVTS